MFFNLNVQTRFSYNLNEQVSNMHNCWEFIHEVTVVKIQEHNSTQISRVNAYVDNLDM